MTLYLRNQRLQHPAERDTGQDLDGYVNWHQWKVRAWPYLHIDEGDEIILVESWPQGSMVSWHAVVTNLTKEPYSSHEDVIQILRADYSLPEGELRANNYLKNGPTEGWLLAWNYMSSRRIDVPRPKGLTFQRNGWRRTDDLDSALLKRLTAS